jgi:hypothetical protein
MFWSGTVACHPAPQIRAFTGVAAAMGGLDAEAWLLGAPAAASRRAARAPALSLALRSAPAAANGPVASNACAVAVLALHPVSCAPSAD